MATRVPHISNLSPDPPTPPLQTATISGHVGNLNVLPTAVDTDQIDVDYILNKGLILYYYRLASSKYTKTKHGLCFLLKDNFGTFQMVTFIKPKEVKHILIHNCDYFFYSDLSLIETSQRDHYLSAIQEISEEAMEYLLPHLLTKDWKNHSNQTPFISISAFLHHIISTSAHVFMIKRLSSNLDIDWGFVDNKGNSFIHAACELKRNIDLTKVIIDNAMNQNHLLINVANFENQTPLRLCIERINQPRGDYSSTSVLVEYLIKKGSTLIIHKNESESMEVTDQLFIDCFQAAKEEKSELIIAYEFPKKNFQNSLYIYSKLNELNHCQIVRTNKLQKKPDLLANMLKEQFDLVLQTNCPEIIEYIFKSRNALLSKVNIATDTGDTMVHLAVRYANPTILRYFLIEYENWGNTNDFGDNIIHTCIEYRNFTNLKVLVDVIPKQDLDQLLFTPNHKAIEIIPYNSIMQETDAFESLVIAIRKECSNEQGSNFLHIAVEKLNLECLTFLALNTPVLFFSTRNNIGHTPLQLAIIHQFIPAVELLLEHSSTNLDSEDIFGFNFFHNSIKYYNEVIFKMVLSAVKKFDAKHPMNKLIDACTHQKLFTARPCLLSIQLEKLDVTELLISHGAKICVKDVDPPSLLNITKEFRSLKRLFMLKLDGRNMTGLRNPTNIQDLEFNRNHLLEYFYFNGEFNDFQKCFRDLSLSNICQRNTELNTILHLAVENPWGKKLEFLLNEISALVRSDERALQLINAINGKGETALYLAVKKSYHALAKRILDIGASIETLYANENNILHVSIRLGDQIMINILLALSEITKLFCKTNKDGETPVQMLIHNGYINRALTAIEKVSQNVEIQNLKINECHILEYFYLNGEAEQFQRCFQALPITKIIEQNAELNTILHFAIENPFEDKLNFLLDQISDLAQSDERALQLINAINGKGETALYLAVKSSDHVLAKRILNIGASIDTLYGNEDNILHVSIRLGKQAMINVLLAQPEITKFFCIPNKDGETPVQMLIHNGYINQALTAIEKVSQNVEIQNLKINGYQILEYFYLKGEPEQFQRCFQALSVTKIIEQNTELNTILHFAIENPFEDKLNFLLDQISDLAQSDERALQLINAINGKGETALYLAVKSSDHVLANRILNIGASIDTLYGNEDSILHVSIRLGKQAMINVLLAQLEITKFFCIPNKDGETPVQMLIHNGYISQALTAIEKVSQNVEIHNLKINGCHILEYFYMKGEPEQFQRFFQALPVTKIFEQNTEFNTILHLAIQNPFEDKLNFLFDQISALVQSEERAIQLIDAINGKGETALYLAVKKSLHALAKRILDIGASIETVYANGDNILHVSIRLGDKTMIDIFLTRPEITKLFCRQNKDGNIPIYLLIHSGYIDEALVAIGRIRPENLLGDDGEFLLMLAIGLDNQIVQNAIFNRLPIESLFENIQINILHYVITYQNIFSIQRLMRHNIDITVSDSSGKTALHFAIDLRNDQIWSLLFEYLITFNAHTQHEIVDIPNLKDPNLFQYSIMENYFPAVKDLLKLRPNIFITHHENEDTIIHLATKLLDCVPILKHLLNQINREDVDALLQSTNSLDLTPLHYAVHCGNTEALKLFQQFNLKIAVPSEGNFFFFNKLFSDKLVFCKHLQTPPNPTQKTFLFGYKVNSPEETLFILTDIPHLMHCKLYQQAEVEVVHRVTEEDLSILLQVPSTDFFQILISKQIINLKNSFSNESTLLHQAARHSNCAVVNYFLKYKRSDKKLARHMDLFAVDSIGNSILYYAIQNSNEENPNEFLSSILTKILERLRANPKFPNILNKENANSKRILEVCFDLNKFDAFKCMLDPTFQMELTYEDSDGYTLLHKIVKGRGDERFLEALFDEIKGRILPESFAKYLNHPTRDLQQTSLHLCILKNQITQLNLILKYSPNFTSKDKDGNTPLHLATKLKSNNEHSATNALIQSLISNILSLEGDTISLLNAVNNQRLTPIYFAIMNGNIHISNFLLSKGANLYVVDNDRKSVLHYAIENEDKDEIEKVIKFLLDYEQTHPNPGNNLLQMQNKKGNTPLHLVILQREEFFNHILTAIVENIKISPDNYHYLTIVNNKGLPPLHFVIDLRSDKIWSLLFEYLTTFKEHTQHKIVDIPNLNHLNLFQYSITQNFFPAVKDLLKLRPNIFITHHENEDTIIHLATKLLDCVPILKHLLNQINREDVDALLQSTNSLDLTPLHYAVHCGNTEALKLFQQFNLKIAVPSEGNFFFFNKLFSDKLVFCKHLQTPPNPTQKTFLFGYKVNSPKETLFILTDIPHLMHCKLYQQAEVEVVHRVTEEDLSILLQVPSTDFFQILISKQIINLKNSFSNESTLLHQAARHSNCAVVNYFLKYKRSDKKLARHMDLFAVDSIGNSILYYAIQNSNEENPNEFLSSILTKILERLRANPKFPNILNKENANSKRILEVCFDLNKFDAFKCMLDPTFQMELTYEDSDGYTLLHKIVKGRGDERFLEALFDEIKGRILPESFAKYLNHPTRDLQQTSLHLCILKNQTTLLNLISKFSPNFTSKDKDGNTPLHLATKLKSNNEHSATNALIQSLISNILSLEGDTISLLNAVNNQRLTPIYFAIMNGNIHISNFLLSKGANLYAVDNDRKSVLHYAIEHENKDESVKVIKFLLDYEQTHPNPGNDLLQMQDKQGNTPLHSAVPLLKSNLFKILLNRSQNLVISNNNKKTVLHLSLYDNCLEIVRLILEYIAVTRGQNQLINMQDDKGNSPLHIAIKYNSCFSLKKLLSANATLDLKDNSGQTPLHLAILKGEEVFNHILMIIKEKIQLSPDNYHYLTIVNNDGLPPLHFALMNVINMSYIEKLINIGAKLSYTDKMGSITMCAGKGGLDLCLLKQVKYGSRFQLLNHFSEGWIGANWFVGFKAKHFPFWVVTKLLGLEEIEIMEEQNVTEVTQFCFEDEILVNLIKCESIDPIRVAIEKNLFPHETIKNGKKLLSFVQDKNGSASVEKFVKESFRPVEEICFWIKTSVFNLKEMSLIFESLHTLNLTLIMPDSSKLLGEELKRNEISIALSNALLYSLDNDSIEYFNFLLSHNLCLNAQYGIEKDSLLHTMIKKEKSNEFLALFLNTVCEYETKSEEKILIKGEPLIDARNAESLTPLALCVINKQERILYFLLTHKPSITVLSESGNSILHYVATAGDEAIAEIIFSKILNSPDNVQNLFNMPNSDGCIPLHLAVEKGNVKISEMFLNNGSKFYLQDYAKRTILHHAIENPDQTLHSSMIEFILAYEVYEQHKDPVFGKKIVEIGGTETSIPLNYAINKKSLNAVKLLAPYPSTLRHRDQNNQSVLHLVCGITDNDIVDEVLNQISIHQDKYRDVFDCIACYEDEKGLTALQICIMLRNKHALRKLLTQKLCLNLPNCQRNLKLKQAIRNETDPEFKILLEEMQSNSGQIAEFHLYSENAQNIPPLHSAIEKGNISGVQILLKQGAKLAHKQKCGTITFWDQKTNLKLCILLDLRDKSIIYAGYKLASHTKWVVSKLPQISKTEIRNSNEVLLLDSVDSLNALHLSIIFRCHSIEPFAAICNFLCSDDMIEEDTLIEFAGKFSTAEVMTFFINYFKIEVFRRNKISLLESAIKHNPDVDTISLILKHLPRIENLELPGIQGVKYNRDQLIALCLYNSFEISLSREDTAVFNILHRFGVKLNNPYGKDAGTILHLMATKNASKFVIPLLDWLRESNKTITFNNVRFIDAQNNLGETALHLFVKAELIPQIKLILNLSPNLSLTDRNGNNILHVAVQTKCLTALTTLTAEVKKANCQSLINFKNAEGLIPLHIAIENFSLGITEHLVQSGSSLFLALHHAVELGVASKRIECINLFLEKERENRDHDVTFLTRAQDMCKRTPLHLAVINQLEETVELLLKVDPFVLLHTDKNKRTPLHLAATKQNLKILEMITNAIQMHSAADDWEKENVFSMPDFENKTAMHLCIEFQNRAAFVILLEAIYYLDLKDKNGNSLLHYAVRYPGDGASIELLLERLAERFPESMSQYLYAENNDQIPPLQYAIKNDHLKGARALIGYQANLAYNSTPDCFSLCHGKLGLTIEFLQREVSSKVGRAYFAGMKIGADSWIACSLPDLKSTTLFSTKQVELVKTFSDKFLLAILRSQSIEPFMAAFNSKLNYFTLDAKFKDGRQLKHLVAQHASRQVMSHFLTLYNGPVCMCENGVMSMVEYAVLNRTDPKTLEWLLQTIRNGDNPMLNQENSTSIDSCFQRAFILSLENNYTPKSIFKLLLEYTLKVDYRFGHNNTLLHLIIENSKDLSSIEFLFTKLKNTGNMLLNNSPFIDAQNSDLRTALHTCIELGQLANMKTLLSYSPDLGKQDKDLNTVLLLAAMQDRLEFVEALVEHSPNNIIESKNRAGFAPIHYAVKNGNCLMTRLLLDSNADRFTTDNDGRNILHHALANVNSFTRKQLVKCILSNANAAGIVQERRGEETPALTLMRDKRGYSPLHLAVLIQSVNVIRILLNSNPQALFLGDRNMRTPLHLSVIPGTQVMEKTDPLYSLCKPTFVNEIFNEIFEFINIEDKHRFCVHCNMNNIICYQDRKKRTAMHYAIQYNYPHALGRLLRTGSCLDIRDDKGEDLMHEAIGNPDSGMCLDILTNEMNERSKY